MFDQDGRYEPLTHQGWGLVSPMISEEVLMTKFLDSEVLMTGEVLMTKFLDS